MFKLSRFHQERFTQELCCDSFAMAIASWPYSNLRITPWSGILWVRAALRSRRPHATPVVSLGNNIHENHAEGICDNTSQ